MKKQTIQRITLPTRDARYFGDEDDGLATVRAVLDSPAVQAQFNDRLETETAGLRANKDEILGEKRDAVDKLKALEAQWSGMDPEIVRTLMARLENDEEAKLIAEGKFDDVIERRTKRALEQADADVTAARTRVTELETSEASLQGRLKRLVLDGAIHEAASTAELLPSAIADAVQRAHQIFQVNENEVPVAMDGDTILRGKDGSTALTVGEWLDGMKKVAPHWWAPSNGGGSQGGKGGNDKTTTEEAIGKLSARGKLALGLEQQS